MRPIVAPILMALLTVCSAAMADSTSECIAASEAAQSLRDRRAFLQARDKFAVCSADACPGAIRADCLQQRREVDAALPTVVFRARDAHAQDLVDVRVLCDGAPLATQLDGKALAVDPGSHVFRFEAVGSALLDRKLVIGEGEKNRLIVVDLAPGTPGTQGPAAQSAPPEGAAKPRSWVPGVVVGAVGVAATIPMAILWAVGTSDVHSMQQSCAPSAGGAGCPADRVDSDRTKLVVGDVFMGVAAAGIATGAVLLILNRGGGATPAQQGVLVEASPTRGGALLSAGLRF